MTLLARRKTPPTLPPIDPFEPYRFPHSGAPASAGPADTVRTVFTGGGGSSRRDPPPPNPLAFSPPSAGTGKRKGRNPVASPPPAKKQSKRKKAAGSKQPAAADGVVGAEHVGAQQLPTHIDPRNLADPWAPRAKQRGRRQRGGRIGVATPSATAAAAAAAPERAAEKGMTCSGPVVEQDVVWYLGARTGDGFQWKPQDQVLGGSEQAVVELSRVHCIPPPPPQPPSLPLTATIYRRSSLARRSHSHGAMRGLILAFFFVFFCLSVAHSPLYSPIGGVVG